MMRSKRQGTEMADTVKRYGSFICALAGMWFFCFGFAPWLVESIPELKQMAAFVEDEGIETGEFYYTDVEIVSRADQNARNTMEYLPKGPGPVTDSE